MRAFNAKGKENCELKWSIFILLFLYDNKIHDNKNKTILKCMIDLGLGWEYSGAQICYISVVLENKDLRVSLYFIGYILVFHPFFNWKN